MVEKKDLISVITPVGKFLFVYIDTPQPDDKGVDWYKLTIAWPKEYKDTELKHFRSEGMRAAKQFFGDSVPKLQTFLRDGDNPEHNSSDVEELHGCLYITAKSKTKPGCTDRSGKTEISPLDVYSGASGRVSVLLGGYDNLGKKGVWIRLQNIQKAADGERIGGKPKASDQFSQLDGFVDEDDDMPF